MGAPDAGDGLAGATFFAYRRRVEEEPPCSPARVHTALDGPQRGRDVGHVEHRSVRQSARESGDVLAAVRCARAGIVWSRPAGLRRGDRDLLRARLLSQVSRARAPGDATRITARAGATRFAAHAVASSFS